MSVRNRMVELGIIQPGKKICTKKYLNTRKTDAIIRKFQGHTSTIYDILKWPMEIILKRAIELGVRKKGEHLPHDIKYIHRNAIDDVIIKYGGYVPPIHAETGWHVEAIRNRAAELNIKPTIDKTTGRVYTYQKMYIPTDEVDQIIRTSWMTKHKGGGAVITAVKSISVHAKLTKTPLWSEAAVVNRARELGLVQARKVSNGKDWTEKENAVLRNNSHHTSATIQKKLLAAFPASPRTQTAISTQIGRLKSEETLGTDYFTMEQMEAYLHTSNIVLIRYMGRGALKGYKREDGAKWCFHRADVREFVLTYPDAVDLMLVDKLWLFDLLGNGQVGKSRTTEMERDTREWKKSQAA